MSEQLRVRIRAGATRGQGSASLPAWTTQDRVQRPSLTQSRAAEIQASRETGTDPPPRRAGVTGACAVEDELLAGPTPAHPPPGTRPLFP